MDRLRLSSCSVNYQDPQIILKLTYTPSCGCCLSYSRLNDHVPGQDQRLLSALPENTFGSDSLCQNVHFSVEMECVITVFLPNDYFTVANLGLAAPCSLGNPLSPGNCPGPTTGLTPQPELATSNSVYCSITSGSESADVIISLISEHSCNEWDWREGRYYGTILVDREIHCIVYIEVNHQSPRCGWDDYRNKL